MTDEEWEKRTQICRECPVHMMGIGMFGMIFHWTNCLFSSCPNSKNYQCHEAEKEDA
jgi:hypothetical protein